MILYIVYDGIHHTYYNIYLYMYSTYNIHIVGQVYMVYMGYIHICGGIPYMVYTYIVFTRTAAHGDDTIIHPSSHPGYE